MNKTKILVLSGLMACISTLFQILPAILSEAFVLLTLFSALPIYIICRINIKAGLATCLVSFILISFFTVHEALFFIFTNGSIGASLGCFSHLNKRTSIISSLSSVILFTTLCILNFIIGIPVFGLPLPGIFLVQILIIFIFSFVYCFIYSCFCNFIFKRINIEFTF